MSWREHARALGLLVVVLGLALPVAAQDAAGQDLAQRIAERRDAAGQVQPAEPTGASASDPTLATDAAAAEVPRTTAGDPLGPVGDELVIPDEPTRAEELLPLGREPGEATQQGGSPATPSLGGGWMLNTLAALGVVIGLILVLRWVVKRTGVTGKAVASTSAVEVLSRTTVAPRNHIVLLRVGPRVLVVNDSGSGMRTLANIEDPNEVAELLQSVQAQRVGSATQSFSGVMSRLVGKTPDEDTFEESVEETSTEQVRDTLAGLRGRLSSLSALSRGQA